MCTSSNTCRLSHRRPTQLRGKVSQLQTQSERPCRYFPGFDIIAPIDDYILWNVTRSCTSKYSRYPALACPEQENLRTAKEKDWPWRKHH